MGKKRLGMTSRNVKLKQNKTKSNKELWRNPKFDLITLRRCWTDADASRPTRWWLQSSQSVCQFRMPPSHYFCLLDYRSEFISCHMVRTTGQFSPILASVIKGRAVQQVVQRAPATCFWYDPAFHPSFLLAIGSWVNICSKLWYFCSQ